MAKSRSQKKDTAESLVKEFKAAKSVAFELIFGLAPRLPVGLLHLNLPSSVFSSRRLSVSRAATKSAPRLIFLKRASVVPRVAMGDQTIGQRAER